MEHKCRVSFTEMPIVYYADCISAEEPFVHVDRTADFDVMIYLIEGKMFVIEDGIEYILVPGTIFFLKRGVHHWGEKKCEPNTKWCYVHFRVNVKEEDSLFENKKYTLLRDFYPNDDTYKKYFKLPKILYLNNENSICISIRNYVDFFNASDLSKIMKASAMFLSILIDCYELSNINDENSKANHHISNIIKFLEKNYEKTFSLEEIGRAVNLNPKYASALFKKETGQNLSEYFIALKINKAKHMLCETNLTIEYISNSIGFSDQFYFSKVFKKLVGMPPGKYRNECTPMI